MILAAEVVTDPIASMSGHLARLASVEAQRIEVRVNSLTKFAGEIDRRVGLKPIKSGETVANTFMGVEVKENWIIPENMAVILNDGEIVAVIKFA